MIKRVCEGGARKQCSDRPKCSKLVGYNALATLHISQPVSVIQQVRMHHKTNLGPRLTDFGEVRRMGERVREGNVLMKKRIEEGNFPPSAVISAMSSPPRAWAGRKQRAMGLERLIHSYSHIRKKYTCICRPMRVYFLVILRSQSLPTSFVAVRSAPINIISGLYSLISFPLSSLTQGNEISGLLCAYMPNCPWGIRLGFTNRGPYVQSRNQP